jgi:hypothetical protein
MNISIVKNDSLVNDDYILIVEADPKRGLAMENYLSAAKIPNQRIVAVADANLVNDHLQGYDHSSNRQWFETKNIVLALINPILPGSPEGWKIVRALTQAGVRCVGTDIDPDGDALVLAGALRVFRKSPNDDQFHDFIDNQLRDVCPWLCDRPIILVEENKQNGEIIANYLEQRGFSCTWMRRVERVTDKELLGYLSDGTVLPIDLSKQFFALIGSSWTEPWHADTAVSEFVKQGITCVGMGEFQTNKNDLLDKGARSCIIKAEFIKYADTNLNIDYAYAHEEKQWASTSNI